MNEQKYEIAFTYGVLWEHVFYRENDAQAIAYADKIFQSFLSEKHTVGLYQGNRVIKRYNPIA